MYWNNCIVACYSIVLLIGSVGNFLVILVTIKCRKFHTMRFILLASLSLCDLLFHLLVIPFYAISLACGEWIFGFAWCRATVYLSQCLGMSTVLHLCAVTWDCHSAVTKPFSFSENKTVKKYITLAFVWVVPVVYSSAPFFGWGKIVYSSKSLRCERKWQDGSYFISLFVLFFVIPLLIITKQQLEIRKIVKQQTRQMNRQRQQVDHNKQEPGSWIRVKKDVKASKDVLVVIGAFLCSYCPLLIFGAFRFFFPTSNVIHVLWSFAFCLFHAGAAWNPIIYSVRKRRFRRELFRLFKGTNFRIATAPPQRNLYCLNETGQLREDPKDEIL